MDLQEVGWGGGMDRIYLTQEGQGQVAGACECGNEPSDFYKTWGNFLTS